MIDVVGVSFKRNGKIYYFLPDDFKLKKNDKVIVKTEKGLQLGTIDLEKFSLEENKIKNSLNSVIRLCTKKDIDINEKNVKDAKIALQKCKKLVEKYKLNMFIMDASYTFDRSQLLFTFLADSRIDFRNLAKELANLYKTRIELRQVGIRDKAREIGGYGCCGRPLCCSKFLYDFDSVSINMAKNQNIALNPNKINGCCGRLLCCLKYEDDYYKECSKHLPKIGKKVNTPEGEGRVISVDVLRKKYKVDVKDKGIIEVVNDESN